MDNITRALADGLIEANHAYYIDGKPLGPCCDAIARSITKFVDAKFANAFGNNATESPVTWANDKRNTSTPDSKRNVVAGIIFPYLRTRDANDWADALVIADTIVATISSSI